MCHHPSEGGHWDFSLKKCRRSKNTGAEICGQIAMPSSSAEPPASMVLSVMDMLLMGTNPKCFTLGALSSVCLSRKRKQFWNPDLIISTHMYLVYVCVCDCDCDCMCVCKYRYMIVSVFLHGSVWSIIDVHQLCFTWGRVDHPQLASPPRQIPSHGSKSPKTVGLWWSITSGHLTLRYAKKTRCWKLQILYSRSSN